VVLLVWLYSLQLRSLGEPAPRRTALLLISGGLGVLVPYVLVNEWRFGWPLVVFAVFSFVVLRWRLLGRGLLLRLPGALAAAAVLVFTLPLLEV
ncbi:hypothetical protein, partial [Winogradskyella ouciana]|uniref:hypothetical protein n=1 Tax=Winogradskyella ouciana TaxID=2608631 RepID=UPI0013903BA2